MIRTIKIFSARANIILALLIVISLFLRFMPPEYKLQISRGIIDYLYFPFSSLGLVYQSYQDSREENLELRRQVIELVMRLNRLKEAEKENARLRQFFEFEPPPEFDFLLARVIAKGKTRGSIAVSYTHLTLPTN